MKENYDIYPKSILFINHISEELKLFQLTQPILKLFQDPPVRFFKNLQEVADPRALFSERQEIFHRKVKKLVHVHGYSCRLLI